MQNVIVQMQSRSFHGRASHWVKLNHQCRIPKRWVAFDTESNISYSGTQEIQTFKMGAGIRWRHGLKTGDHAEACTFTSALEMWKWITDYCRTGQRTAVAAHNLGHDARIGNVFEILPSLGFRLEWCNLDSNVSAMTWRSDKGTLVLWDTFTWLPLALASIAPSVGLPKLQMPKDTEGHRAWERYCMRDAEIAYRCVKELINFIASRDLGNWQPTGAGMAYATWRHKFMTHKVLVHDNEIALLAERAAMHTGRAEAWRHGRLEPVIWSEVDMRDAYVRIASECDVPVKLKYQSGAITHAQYSRLCDKYRVLCRVHCNTHIPCVPCDTGTKTFWPVGEFDTWLWDTELALLAESGQDYTITDSYCYTSGPALQEWAQWILSVRAENDDIVSPVVKTWAKHCGRANIGRIALRCAQWEYFGGNPDQITGITRCIDADTGKASRMMHVGPDTFIETARTEGRDSLPQITGWIMAECRVRLWRALEAAGATEVAHVDTDSLLVSATGLRRLRSALGADFGDRWHVKGSWRRVIVYSPRNYRTGSLRKTSGVPGKATEILPNVFKGEKWSGIASDLTIGRHNAVTVETGTWELNATDPRRRDAPGTGTATLPYEIASDHSLIVSSSAKSGAGA